MPLPNTFNQRTPFILGTLTLRFVTKGVNIQNRLVPSADQTSWKIDRDPNSDVIINHHLISMCQVEIWFENVAFIWHELEPTNASVIVKDGNRRLTLKKERHTITPRPDATPYEG